VCVCVCVCVCVSVSVCVCVCVALVMFFFLQIGLQHFSLYKQCARYDHTTVRRASRNVLVILVGF